MASGASKGSKGKDKAAPAPTKPGHNRYAVLARVLGVVFAVALAIKLGPAPDVDLPRLRSLISEDSQMQQALDEMGVTFDKLRDYLPMMTGLMEREEPDENPKPPETELEAKHPVVIIPGMTNTPLDLYKGRNCAARWLRRRLWGSLSVSARLFTSNVSCFLDHLELDETTGLDPPDITVRAAQDIGSVEVVFGMEMWKHAVDKLVAMGYDPNTMAAFPYDWRLAPMDLERRDALLSRVRNHVELMLRVHGEKVALFSHSYGGNVVQHFLTWVEATAGEGWVEKHLAVVGHIGVPLLGVPKALPAMLSGETKDTAGFGGMGVRMGDMLMPRKQRLRVVRSFGCIIVMLPKGGNLVWGSLSGEKDGDALDDCQRQRGHGDMDVKGNSTLPHGAFLTINRNGTVEELDVEAASRLLLERVPPAVKSRIKRQGALYADIDGFRGVSEEYADVLVTPLPNAPSLRILCLYGVDNPTERRYFYRDSNEEDLGTDISLDTDVEDETKCITSVRAGALAPLHIPASMGNICMSQRGWVPASLEGGSVLSVGYGDAWRGA